MFDLSLILKIFVLINPLSSLPVLVAAYGQQMDVKPLAFHALTIAFSLAFIMIFIGPFLFEIFSISIDSFRVAGGTVLFLLGLNTARGETKQYSADKASAVTSLVATPLLTGPATISFITIKTYEIGVIPMVANVGSAFVFVGIVFTILTALIPKIDLNLVGIMSRVLGLFLLAVSIEMLAEGLKAILLV